MLAVGTIWMCQVLIDEWIKQGDVLGLSVLQHADHVGEWAASDLKGVIELAASEDGIRIEMDLVFGVAISPRRQPSALHPCPPFVMLGRFPACQVYLNHTLLLLQKPRITLRLEFLSG